MSDQNITSVPPPPPAVPLPPEPGAKLEYQPVSTWAIFGVLAGGSVAAVVLGSLAYTFLTGTPIQVPAWIVLILSVAGTVVSFIAHRQIVVSEGTRTGMRLARWGLWLSILTGAGFFVFNLSTRLALQSQANAFIMQISPDDEGKKVPDSGFIPRLLEGCKGDRVQFNCAFLLTLPDRGGVDPRDEDAMKRSYLVTGAAKEKSVPYLAKFYDNSMVRLLRDTLRSADDMDKVKIEPQGVLQCDFESPKGKGRGHYKVVRNYQVSTPEYVKTYSIEARSIEPSGPGERRKWFLSLPVEQEGALLTRLGYGMKGLRISVLDYLREWSSKGVRGLRNIDKTNYEELVKARHEQVRHAIDAVDGPAGVHLNQLHFQPVDVTPWERVGGKMRISYPVTIKILVGSPPEGLELRGFITVESDADVDPETFTSTSPSPVWKFPTLKWVAVEPFEAPTKRPNDGKSKGK